MADDGPVLLSRDGAVATLTLNRPVALNTLDFAMMGALVETLEGVSRDATIRVLIVTGAGRHFMAGGDLRAFATALELPQAERPAFFRPRLARLHAGIELLHRMPQIVIAQARGAVAGFGLSLLCACDLAVASDDAYFSAAYRYVGLSPDGGGTYALPRLVGTRKALEILLLGERFEAVEALRLGLVSRVVPGPELEHTVAMLAASLCRGPGLALRNTKALVRASAGRTHAEQLDAEATSFAACTGTADFAEGVAAFIGKRPPVFD